MGDSSNPLLRVDVVPGESIGPFVLGMTLGTTIEWLRSHSREIPQVELLYSEENPFDYDNVLRLTKNGIQLRFTSDSQRLKIVEVFDLSNLQLVYANSIFSSATVAPTFLTVSRLFGPSYPGQFDRKRQHHSLKYPGLSFFFPIPEQYCGIQSQTTSRKEEQAHLTNGADNARRKSGQTNRKAESAQPNETSSPHFDDHEPPLELPDGTTPVARRICVYAPDHRLPPVAGSSTRGLLPVYYDKVKGVPSEGISIARYGMSVRFGDSCQDVMCQLGPPSKIYYKEEDKMRIHTYATQNGGGGGPSGSPSGGSKRSASLSTAGKGRPSQVGTHCSDYFYNYFDLGIDVLFDAERHTVKKIVLHTNLPSHLDFGIYHKCNFSLWVPDEPALSDMSSQSPPNRPPTINSTPGTNDPQTRSTKQTHTTGADSNLKMRNDIVHQARKKDRTVSSSDSSDTEGPTTSGIKAQAGRRTAPQNSAEDRLKGPDAKAERRRKGVSITSLMSWAEIKRILGEPIGLPVIFNRGSAITPFGTTRFHGYDRLIFEVMRNGHIATVTLFATSPAGW
ncbi:hypothetical protein SARC_05169 [Sphaeroforma arctica JP610]|uniref:Uncharacterized protein n=1 Tax=Sphaeroforma arctica JP610 TaxID=667725 RepID=A0A0L0G0A2_9EUKA|nr:hypothetical protein SARC_05169 [Sphaeroforma arctica JP610]KNC82542.1 hypothetical protein SARC_05169 [Sphaeroforma arctica JP610]|eukprot:XP_014156444.1 hypothetical protein SARC_05169 [Sphaeroforma arctica JP610]